MIAGLHPLQPQQHHFAVRCARTPQRPDYWPWLTDASESRVDFLAHAVLRKLQAEPPGIPAGVGERKKVGAAGQVR